MIFFVIATELSIHVLSIIAHHISVSCNGIILIGYIISLCFVSLEFSIALWNESSWFYGIKPKQRNRNKSLNALEVIGHT